MRAARLPRGSGSMIIRRRQRAAPLDFLARLPMQLFLAAVFILLYAPILSLMAFSFNDSRRNIVWRGFTLDYYVKAWNNALLFEAFTNSLLIAVVAAIVSLILGVGLGITLWRFRFPFKGAIEGAVMLPIVAPEICVGVAMLAFFSRIGWSHDLSWPLNLTAIIIAHISFCFPFVAIMIRMRMTSLNREFEEVARDLGAGEWAVFRDVYRPHLRPALIASALIAFTLSLDDFVITFFTSGPNTLTLPVKIYSMVRFSVTPEINAASTIWIAITVIVAAIAFRIQRGSGENRNSPE